MAKTSKRRRNRLTDPQKRFIIDRLACFDSPKEVADAIKEEFGISISPQACEHYDPNKRAGHQLARHLAALFEDTRRRFLKYVDAHIPEANAAVRIHHLARAARAYKERGNYVAMANMLQIIAKERGGAFTNRRELTGRDRGPIKLLELDTMSEAQVDEELRRYGFDPDCHPAPKGTH